VKGLIHPSSSVAQQPCDRSSRRPAAGASPGARFATSFLQSDLDLMDVGRRVRPLEPHAVDSHCGLGRVMAVADVLHDVLLQLTERRRHWSHKTSPDLERAGSRCAGDVPTERRQGIKPLGRRAHTDAPGVRRPGAGLRTHYGVFYRRARPGPRGVFTRVGRKTPRYPRARKRQAIRGQAISETRTAQHGGSPARVVAEKRLPL